MTYVKGNCPEQLYIVTADSDGQHTVADVLRMAESLTQNSKGLLLGSRDFSQPDVPFKSRTGNRITSTVFSVLYGVHISDTQTGLRGFHRDLLPIMISVKGGKYVAERQQLVGYRERRTEKRK